MAIRYRARDRGRRQALALRSMVAEELRNARLSAGLTQAHVARVSGLSQTRVSRTERVNRPKVSVDELAIHCATLGLKLVIKTYPDGSPVRDAAHLQLLQRFRQLVAASFRWHAEAPIGPSGDLRAWDVLLTGPSTIGIDAETRLHDIQALQRRTELKRRDSHVDRVVLLVRDSHHNRAILREHQAALRASFPLGTGQVLKSIREGQGPREDGIVVM